MLLSPSPVTSDDHDGPSVENPWANSGDAPQDNTDEAASKPTKNDTRQVQGRTAHIRSHTTAGHPLYAPPSSDEQDDAFARRTSLDLHETRPSLRRAIIAGLPTVAGEEPNDVRGRRSREGSGPRPKETDAEVIVHEIQPTDSLPGVALKYDISVAALRSANKLWASDSIHLRQVLYIPVQAVANGPQFRSLPLHSASDLSTHSSPHSRRSASEWDNPSEPLETTITHAHAADVTSARTTSTVKRVPLSELSFFPPSSTSLSASGRPDLRPTRATSSRTKPSRSLTSTLPRGSSMPTTPFFPGMSGGNRDVIGPPPLRLTSFLNGAKDEIMSRLSLDSIRGSSDAGEDPEVEMDVVRSASASDQQTSDKNLDIRSWQRGTTARIPDGWAREAVVLDTPRKSKAKMVTTVQLQPSPRMEIPVTSGVDKRLNGSEQSSVPVEST